MKTNDDGGFAFPSQRNGAGGMSLLDWFAGQALIGLLSNKELQSSIKHTHLAALAYNVASEMIVQRDNDA